jgi:hypothetical protein
MVYNLMQSAAKRWRLLNGFHLLTDVTQGVQFTDVVRCSAGVDSGAGVASCHDAFYFPQSIRLTSSSVTGCPSFIGPVAD